MPVLEVSCNSACSACGAARCSHDSVLSRLLGCEDSALCFGCLAFTFGLDPSRFATGAVAHLRKKSCLWLSFEKRRGCGCALEKAKSEAEFERSYRG